jgi:hypothetical protein
MRNGQAFVGFREAAINFPPTFKYDVLRTTRHKRKRSKHSQVLSDLVAPLSQGSTKACDQPEAEEAEEHQDGGHSDGSSEDDTNGELASVVSSVTTALSQRSQLSDEDDDNDSGAESDYLRRRMGHPERSGLVKRISLSAAQRAKSKWAEIINAQSSPRIIRSRRANAHTPQVKGDGKSSRSVPTTPLLGEHATSPASSNLSETMLASVTALKGRPQSSLSLTGDGTAETEDDKGVYDSSSKRRVPSWCDRILFKSTVEPDPESEDDAHATPQRTAVSLFAQAWRSFRRTSSTSLRSVSNPTSTPATATTTTTNSFLSSPAADSAPDPACFLPTPYVPRRKRPRPRSIDIAALPSSSQPMYLTTSRPATATNAQTHRFPDMKGNRDASLNAPARSLTAPSPDQHLREPSLSSRTPVSSFESSTTASSSSAPSSGSGGGTSGFWSHPHPSPRWRLLSFLSRDAEAARDAAEAVAAAGADADANANAEPATRMTATASAPPSPSPGNGFDGASAGAGAAESSRHRKGDVVCLSYRTLDDRGMRRLEGRSDHRPVIGVYAIYV